MTDPGAAEASSSDALEPSDSAAREAAARATGAARVLGEAARVRGELARRFDAWLELARAPQDRLPADHRDRLLDALERVEALRRDLGATLAEVEDLLLDALRGDPAQEELRNLLADGWEAMAAGMSGGASDPAGEHLRRLARQLRNPLTADAEARLTITSEPPGAGVWLTQVGPRGWGWGSAPGSSAADVRRPAAARPTGIGTETPAESVGVPGQFLGATPVAPLTLPPGSYLLTVRGEERAEAALPVRTTRGELQEIRLRLYARAEVGEGFVPVPAGSVLRGNPYLSETVITGAFAIMVFPVTFGAWCEYLDSLAEYDDTEVELRLPRTPRGDALCAPARDTDAFVPCEPGGALIARAVPVVGVSWDSATAYAAWKSARDAAKYRLPTRLEWEKAARGPYGSVYPWGDLYDAAFCLNRTTAGGSLFPQPIGRFPRDVSPYGVRDLGGGVMDWCADGPAGEPNLRWAVGGAFNRDEAASRACGANRFAVTYREEGLGLRLVQSLP